MVTLDYVSDSCKKTGCHALNLPANAHEQGHPCFNDKPFNTQRETPAFLFKAS